MGVTLIGAPAAASGSGVSVLAVKTADTVRANAPTAADPHLLATVPTAGKTYGFTYNLCGLIQTGEFNGNPTYTGTASGIQWQAASEYYNPTNNRVFGFQATNFTTEQVLYNTASYFFLRIWGVFTATTTGSLGFTWRTTSSVTLYAGSQLKLLTN